MVKKSEEKDIWAPHTPEKSIRPTKGPVSVDRKCESHVAGSFSRETSQDSAGFNALTDCIDAAQSLKEASSKSQLRAVPTPSKNDNTWESRKDYIDTKKQRQKKPRVKKYWPKVLDEAKPKKNPKPSTPKPCTPKASKRATSRRCLDEKMKDVGEDCLPSASPKPSKHVQIGGQNVDATYVPESTKRALSFNVQNHERDSGKDARIIIHQYQRRKKNIDRSPCDTKAIERSEEVNLMVKNMTGMTSGFTLTEEWIQPTQLSETEIGATNDSLDINQPGCCNGNSLIVYKRVFRANQCPSSSRKLGPNFPRMWKKRRMTRRKATIYDIFKYVTAAPKKQTFRRQKQTNFGSRRSAKSAKQAQKRVKTSKFPSIMTERQMAVQKEKDNCGGLVPHYPGLMISPTKSQEWSAANDPSSFQCVLSLTPLAMSKKRRSYKSIRMPNLGPSTLIPSISQLPSVPFPQSLHVRVGNQDLLVTDYDIIAAKRQDIIEFLDNAVPGDKEVQGCPKYVLPSTESMQDVVSVPLMDVIVGLEGLHISDAGGQLVVHNQNAHGKDGQQKAVIVYKKRKQPPKVDIDQETMRVWKLLTASRDEDVEEERNEEKEKWWEEQRYIFRGRVDSFVSRMHLVQGDRRFSPWKGSVVDSVVGVFLTQNVSDHLSSSAFMSLAAKYPLGSTTAHKACDEDGEVAYNNESVGSNIRERVQDEILQQDFLDSFIDDPPSTSKHSSVERSSGFSETVQREDTTCLQEFSGDEKGDLLGNESLLDSCISRKVENAKQGSTCNGSFDVNDPPASICSLSSQKQYSYIRLTPFDVEVESLDSGNNTMNDLEDVGENLGCIGSLGSETIVQKKATPRAQEATVELCASLSKCQVLPECSSQAEVNKANVQECIKNFQEGSKISPQTKSPSRKKKRKKKSKVEKQEKSIDWDELRKNYVGSTVSTSDTRDSLDWEEVRQATIDEVAEVIKGRGQHRVLAERIKDFLDRVVTDHGSINLEWLRAVPPDKAKEYLLSFKGLGLKSVECVRLLTLQHHAFPVDTNVGRVAVRLGWVPLKPLPESLQIHLLEQYPVLDTIQIYLWPRLCTLDQRTLYELHYQMITFGKVFCRKRKPNCNACPMRGECRHYASAFSSARLALPGPQGKNTVNSIVPYEAVQNSSLVITPATKSLPVATFSESRYKTKSCEPIIEHPPSPEPESTKYLERDIEDLYDDPEDYIPTIRLDVEEFRDRIQEFIEMNNIPLDGVDISKALVALTSEAASIPLPKLKDINWLRTIHHVYALPDSHRILAGFDKREPDDPSPYLLAIWPSGGTAISSEPSRKLCDSSQESHLCNRDTCSSCNDAQDQNVQTVYGTILIPCRTATRGSFPLNGTYFQVNEVFADDETSQHPLSVPRAWIWPLRRRTLHCGAYAGAIFGDLSVEEKMNLTFEEHYAITQLYIFISAAKNTYFDQIFFKSNYLEFYSLILMEHCGQRIACSV
ncbi:hypothetical protein RHMOL_Rhmol13G0135300 [Rhododendron molle]|uniref:Uncharacterized protein n=4 Tax=Rhododendron molle TaxID=49168 RepID=A0ACC0L684_RHOML|nr:hypothetical protein RHMOL_Rhmol13G0135300 [Rhododendron molle]KAI8524245.1 hypothetical protein RHMOL_Rhmol13G0135300 [Rhododendron molle]KAI8524246.1 hypothetical protein RHMOL_Rhmol13G0135300 [Rhododendron molle]KAI8524247.1 hypothetical protein RHMOL_Rhmol13G0135300 [Rhododendron molle]